MNYSTVVRGNRMQVLVDAIDGKTFIPAVDAGAIGSLVIGTSSLSEAIGVLATIPLQNPSFSVSGIIATLLGVPLSALGTANGIAVKAEIRNNAGTVIVGDLTVGISGSGSHIIIDDATIAISESVSITSGTITHG